MKPDTKLLTVLEIMFGNETNCTSQLVRYEGNVYSLLKELKLVGVVTVIPRQKGPNTLSQSAPRAAVQSIIDWEAQTTGTDVSQF